MFGPTFGTNTRAEAKVIAAGSAAAGRSPAPSKPTPSREVDHRRRTNEDQKPVWDQQCPNAELGVPVRITPCETKALPLDFPTIETRLEHLGEIGGVDRKSSIIADGFTTTAIRRPISAVRTEAGAGKHDSGVIGSDAVQETVRAAKGKDVGIVATARPEKNRAGQNDCTKERCKRTQACQIDFGYRHGNCSPAGQGKRQSKLTLEELYSGPARYARK